MTTKTKAATSMAATKKAVDAALTSMKSSRDLIQIAGVKVLIHAYNHGDYTEANRLVIGLEGANVQSLVNWFEVFGGLVVDENDSSLGFTAWSGKEHIKEQLEAAKAKSWWTCKPMTPFKPYSLDAELEKLAKRAQAQATKADKLRREGEEDKADQIDVNPALLNQLNAMLSSKGLSVPTKAQVGKDEQTAA